MIKKENPDHYTRFGIDTFEKWEALPRAERERRVNFWLTPWYRKPYALQMNLADVMSSAKIASEWHKVDAYLKKEYPIQFRIREAYDYLEMCYLYDVRSAFRKFWNDWIKGQRREMRNAVFQRHYRDLDSIIVDFHIQCLIEFVEREEVFNVHDYTESKADRTFAEALRAQYDYATRERPLLLKKIEEESDRAFREWRGDVGIYKAGDELEALLIDRDTKMCSWVVMNRGRLWS